MDPVFLWAPDRCAEDDVPDAPLRAVRVDDYHVIAFATHEQNRALLGPNLGLSSATVASFSPAGIRKGPKTTAIASGSPRRGRRTAGQCSLLATTNTRPIGTRAGAASRLTPSAGGTRLCCCAPTTADGAFRTVYENQFAVCYELEGAESRSAAGRQSVDPDEISGQPDSHGIERLSEASPGAAIIDAHFERMWGAAPRHACPSEGCVEIPMEQTLAFEGAAIGDRRQFAHPGRRRRRTVRKASWRKPSRRS
jgi:hypothetical protein